MEYAKPPGSAFGPRRVFTAPVVATTQASNSTSARSSEGVVETLYNNPSVRIVAFTAGPRSCVFSPGSGRDAPPVEDIEPGSLPSSSPLERTIAAGPFRIYRAPGSVAFLSCGSALQPILPKSQCWCIDEVSRKFILQIRRPQYWRIEVPIGNAGDNDHGQLLRGVFDKILQFEKTPCPFKRGFYVELPERPQTPAKKRPWTPVTRSFVSTPPTPVTPSQSRLAASKEREVNSRSASPEVPDVHETADGEEGENEESAPIATFLDRLRPFEKEADQKPSVTSSKEDMARTDPLLVEELRPMAGTLPGFQSSRCITAPPQLILDTIPSFPKDSVEVVVKQQSPTESSASFHSTTESWHSPLIPLPPSPPLSSPSSPTKTFPYPHENIIIAKHSPATHQRDISDATITPVIGGDWVLSPTGADIVSLDDSSDASSVYEDAPKSPPEHLDGTSDPIAEHTSSQPQLPSETTTLTPIDTTTTPLPSDPPISTPPATSPALTRRPPIHHRTTTSTTSLRALSPLPPAATLFTPHRHHANRYASSRRAATRLDAVRRIPGAILHKTCEILFSPPSHLLHLMLTVAARISAGEWRGLVFGQGESGEEVRVGWDWSEEEADGQRGRAGGEDDDEEDDDYFSQRSRSAGRGESPGLRRRVARERSHSRLADYGVTTGYTDSGPDDVIDLASHSWEVD